MEGDTAAVEKPPKVPASLYSKSEAPVQLVLCVDTMGQVCVATDALLFRGSRRTHHQAHRPKYVCWVYSVFFLW